MKRFLKHIQIAAATRGHLSLYTWAVKCGANWDEEASMAAAKNGQLALLKKEPSLASYIYVIRDAAASSGKLNILKWLCEDQNLKSTILARKVGMAAAKGGHVHIFQYLQDNGGRYNSSSEFVDVAAREGHLELVKWLKANGYPWSQYTCENAVASRNFELVKWCRENGCEWNFRTCLEAARIGNLEMLKWCKENGCKWNNDASDLDMLKWARLNYCEWTSAICTFAVLNGDFEMLKWARENGCDWSAETSAAAAEKGHLEILEWLKDNGCPDPSMS